VLLGFGRLAKFLGEPAGDERVKKVELHTLHHTGSGKLAGDPNFAREIRVRGPQTVVSNWPWPATLPRLRGRKKRKGQSRTGYAADLDEG
jgi:hypothetical protein